LAYRELDDALGLTDIAITKLLDGRPGKNTGHNLSGLFRQSAFGRLAGYEDVNDAERLALDPAMRAIVGREGLGRAAAWPLWEPVSGESRFQPRTSGSAWTVTHALWPTAGGRCLAHRSSRSFLPHQHLGAPRHWPDDPSFAQWVRLYRDMPEESRRLLLKSEP
jgi:hypothetical protein